MLYSENKEGIEKLNKAHIIDIDNIKNYTRECGLTYTASDFQDNGFGKLAQTIGKKIGTRKVVDLDYGYPQSASAFGDYAIICQDKIMAKHYLVNMRTLREYQVIDYEKENNAHCNSCDFSNTFYSESDYFPLLYISQGNNTKRIDVMRLIGNPNNGDIITMQKIQTIYFPKDMADTLYYMESTLNPNGEIWITGYTQNSYYSGANNKIKFKKYKTPDITAGDVTLSDTKLLDSFEIDFFSTAQDSCIVDNIYMQAFKTDTLISVDLANKKVIDTVNLPGLEFEGLFIWENNLYAYRKDLSKPIHDRGLWILKFFNN